MNLVCIYTCKKDQLYNQQIKETNWYKKISHDQKFKVIFVYADPNLSENFRLEENILTVRATESYDQLSLKTYQMFSACLDLFKFDYLVKVDSSLINYPEYSNGFEKFANKTYFSLKRDRFYQEYNGIWGVTILKNWRGFFQDWADKYELSNIDLKYIETFIADIDWWWQGKCYTIDHDFSNYIKNNGRSYAEKFSQLAGGAEDLLIGLLYKNYTKERGRKNKSKFKKYIIAIKRVLFHLTKKKREVKKPQEEQKTSKLTVSVVICAHNAAKTLQKCLRAITESDFDDFELIVINDGSTDDTVSIASEFSGVRVFNHPENLGLPEARKSALKEATGDIIISLDSDVIMPPSGLSKIVTFFESNPKTEVIQTSLSGFNADPGFFSQYKSLYMNYIFSQLPQTVQFIHGSCFAIRARNSHLYDSSIYFGEDTAYGQKLSALNKKISFIKDLEVLHLKTFTWRSFFINNFNVPRCWVSIYIEKEGWKQMKYRKIGFAHSPKQQIFSVILAPLVLITTLFSSIQVFPIQIPIFLFLIWLLLNLDFFAFLIQKKGIIFGALKAIPITFIDHIVMSAGIFTGLLNHLVASESSE